MNWQRGQISQRRPETGLNWPSLVVPTGSRSSRWLASRKLALALALGGCRFTVAVSKRGLRTLLRTYKFIINFKSGPTRVFLYR